MSAVEFTYEYAFPSALTREDTGARLRLATCGRAKEHPFFFDGTMLRPREVSDALLVLSDVVRTHFFLPRPPQMDPVLTSSESMLRLEGFSGCCGVYARVDLPADAFDGEIQTRGTTNVDFNDPMRTALTRVHDRDAVRLAVGRDEVVLTREDEKTIEKKVKLPVRWIKGFSEVQAYQPQLTLKHEVKGPAALRFVRSLPKSGAPKRPSFVVGSGSSLRVSLRESSGAVRVSGLGRIAILEPLLRRATAMRVWGDDATGTSGWEVVLGAGSLFLMVSPELYRGFSGEGQVLETLARGRGEKLLARVRAGLKWQNDIDVESFAKRLDVPASDVVGALALLGARGLAGYDVRTDKYFHRELPFDLSRVEELQPRLLDARALVESNGVRLTEQHDAESFDLHVVGTDVEHYVRLRQELDRCTCPWFSRHRGERGPCKHILAAQLFVEVREMGDDVDAGDARRTGATR